MGLSVSISVFVTPMIDSFCFHMKTVDGTSSLEVGNNKQATDRYSCFISSSDGICEEQLVSPLAFFVALSHVF